MSTSIVNRVGISSILIQRTWHRYLRDRAPLWSLVLTLLSVFSIAAAAVSMQMQREWAAFYNGPAYNSIDEGQAIAVDATGNVYVAGSSQGVDGSDDYVTIKYDANGNEMWAARYNGGNGRDVPLAIALDSEGNVYVTGTSVGMDTTEDYATIKYDSNGNEIWAARFNGTGRDDRPRAIAVDSIGNVYVTGISFATDTSGGYATIKYDPNGNEIWAAIYAVPSSDGGPVALAVDGGGNVYVTGWVGAPSDYATIKYDANGNQLWVAFYNGPGNDWDLPCDFLVDPAGNVYVTGQSVTQVASADATIDTYYATIKYDTNGQQLWVALYGGLGNGNAPSAIVVDTAGNVYVTGSIAGDTFDNYGNAISVYGTVKYDASGNQLWAARHGNPAGEGVYARALAVDPVGDLYVTGEYSTVKYDASGNELWAAYPYPRYYFGGHAYVIDASGNVYTTGSIDDPSTNPAFPSKNIATSKLVPVQIDSNGGNDSGGGNGSGGGNNSGGGGSSTCFLNAISN